MKSILLISILLFLCSSSLELKVKKSETVMEFYNSLFAKKKAAMKNSSSGFTSLKNNLASGNNNKFRMASEAKNFYSANEPDDPEKKAEGAEAQKKEEEKKETPSDSTSPTGLGSSSPIIKAPAIGYEGYHKISSKLFQSSNLYPPIKTINDNGQEETVTVKYDSADYRINESFKEGLADRDERDFYFILKEKFLFYKVDDKDLNVLHTFDLEKFNQFKELIPEWQLDTSTYFCFLLTEEMTKYEYKLCSKQLAENRKLLCAIANFHKKELSHCRLNQITGEIERSSNTAIPTVIKETVQDTTILVPLPTRDCNDKWNYINHGDDWECLCKEGVQQSPIDLPDPQSATLSPVTPLFEFDEVSSVNKINTIDGEIKQTENLKLKYNDGALRLMHYNLGKIVTLNGAVYIAEEISIHTPSEHTIQGKRFDMEIQITFYGQSTGDIAKQVVLSFLFQKQAGYYNKFIDDLDFYTLPNKYNTEKNILNNLFIPKILYSFNGDADDELPVMKPFSFYTYDGSLTMPPCTEDTIHYVAAEPIPIGSVVLDLAKEALKMPDMERVDENQNKQTVKDEQVYENYRNTQNVNNRNVFYFDHKKYCGGSINNIIPEKKPQGHYEKIKKKIMHYIYVPSQTPSHIPNSFVVSEQEAKNLANNIKVESNDNS